MESCFNCEFIDIVSSSLDHGAGSPCGKCEHPDSGRKGYFWLWSNPPCSFYKKQQFMKLPSDMMDALFGSIKKRRESHDEK